jgi:site-specific DNA-methyltransferase (adenine-specific)
MPDTRVEIVGEGPWEDDDYGRRYRADAYVLLECLDPDCVEAIITDPPYEINIGNQAWDRRDIHVDWLAYQFARVTKPDGHVFVFCSDLQFGSWHRELSLYFTKVRKFAWCKTNPEQGKLDALKDFAESFELAIHASNDESGFCQTEGYLNHVVTPVVQGRQRSKYKRLRDGKRKKLHTAQKHLDVLDHVICAMTKEGDTILDPFAGTHTTALAAANRGRYYITNDVTPYYWWVDEDKVTEGWLAKSRRMNPER